MTRIKICGICRGEDAAMAAREGADAVGMMMARGFARSVSVEEARNIVARVPAFVGVVGLFVDATTEEIIGAVRELGLSAVQLHGDETPEQVAALKPVRVIKALRVGRGDESVLTLWREAIGRLDLTHLSGILLETAGGAAGGAYGGTGVANDWDGLCEMKEKGAFLGLPPLIAAGGLRAESVGDVVRRLRPYAVDLCSGVERSKREKSEEKVREFVRAVKMANETSIE
jgi:phosphoribosylanthranilate isomerase